METSRGVARVVKPRMSLSQLVSNNSEKRSRCPSCKKAHEERLARMKKAQREQDAADKPEESAFNMEISEIANNLPKPLSLDFATTVRQARRNGDVVQLKELARLATSFNTGAVDKERLINEVSGFVSRYSRRTGSAGPSQAAIGFMGVPVQEMRKFSRAVEVVEVPGWRDLVELAALVGTPTLRAMLAKAETDDVKARYVASHLSVLQAVQAKVLGTASEGQEQAKDMS